MTDAASSPLHAALTRHAKRDGDDAVVACFRDFLASHPDVFQRHHPPGHFTGSAWLVSADGERVLLTHHRKLGRWFQLGGHADGDTDLARVALREAEEESGVCGLVVEPDIFDLDRHRIPARGHEPEHWHYDVRFVVRATRDENFRVGEESLDLAWRSIRDLVTDNSIDASIRRMARRWLDRMQDGPASVATNAPWQPELTSARLRLDALRPEDAGALFDYRADPRVSRYQGWRPNMLAEAEGFIDGVRRITFATEGTWFQWALRDRHDEALIGDLGLHFLDADSVELGITLSPAQQGQCLASEALREVLGFVFEQLGRQQVVAHVDPRNSDCIRLLERLGMRRDEVASISQANADSPEDLVYALRADAWRARNPAS